MSVEGNVLCKCCSSMLGTEMRSVRIESVFLYQHKQGKTPTRIPLRVCASVSNVHTVCINITHSNYYTSYVVFSLKSNNNNN